MTFDLTELKKRLQPQSALAVTISGSKIMVDLVRLGSGNAGHSQFVLPMEAEVLLKTPENIGRELASALHQAGIRERRVVLCVPPAWAVSTSAELPEVGQEDLRSFFELRVEGEFSMGAADLAHAHSAYSLPDGSRRATLVAIPSKKMAAIEKMLSVAGCHAVSISLAIPQCLAGPHLSFLAGENQTDLVVTGEGGIMALRSLANPADLPAAVNAFLREVRITLGRFPGSVRQMLTGARFSGISGSALLQMIQDGLRAMGLEAEYVEEDPNPAVECAQSYLRKEIVPFEFVVVTAHPWAARWEKLNNSRLRHVALAASMVVFLPLLAFLVQSHRESRLEAEWNEMKNPVAESTVTQQKIRQFRPWFEPVPHSLGILENLMGAFPENGEVWSKSVQVEAGSKVTCTGFARTEAARMGLLERLRKKPGITELKTLQVRGENPIQFAITFRSETRDE